jgi:hypothetical protein
LFTQPGSAGWQGSAPHGAQTGKSPFCPGCVVADAVPLEPVLLTGKITGNFLNFSIDSGIASHVVAQNWALLSRFPTTENREFSARYQGRLWAKQA